LGRRGSGREPAPDPNANGLVADFARLLGNVRAREFCRRLAALRTSGFRKSWIGVNFAGREVLGLKLYFTFYEPFDASVLAAIPPDPALRADFQAGIAAASPRHARDPSLPGSGYTFCIKIDRGGEHTYGFYCRVGRGDKGIFRLHGPTVHHKEYSYVRGRSAKVALARRFRLPFAAECTMIEHGRGRGHGFASTDDDEKLILIGDFAQIESRLFDDGERAAIGGVEAAFGLRACCAGVYRNGVKSFYLVRPAASGKTRVSTIESVYRTLARRRPALGPPRGRRRGSTPWQ
jgi:hypothetical protein